jgi:hypothetical protein
LATRSRCDETATCGGDALMRAEAFAAVGGFRPQLIAGEEPGLYLGLREKDGRFGDWAQRWAGAEYAGKPSN